MAHLGLRSLWGILMFCLRKRALVVAPPHKQNLSGICASLLLACTVALDAIELPHLQLSKQELSAGRYCSRPQKFWVWLF